MLKLSKKDAKRILEALYVAHDDSLIARPSYDSGREQAFKGCNDRKRIQSLLKLINKKLEGE